MSKVRDHLYSMTSGLYKRLCANLDELSLNTAFVDMGAYYHGMCIATEDTVKGIHQAGMYYCDVHNWVPMDQCPLCDEGDDLVNAFTLDLRSLQARWSVRGINRKDISPPIEYMKTYYPGNISSEDYQQIR